MAPSHQSEEVVTASAAAEAAAETAVAAALQNIQDSAARYSDLFEASQAANEKYLYEVAVEECQLKVASTPSTTMAATEAARLGKRALRQPRQ